MLFSNESPCLALFHVCLMKPLAVSTETHCSSLPAHWSPSQSWQKWQSVKTQSAFHGILQLDCNVAMSPTYIILCVSTASFVIKMTCVLKDIILVPYCICNLEREAQCLMVLRSKWHYAKLSRDSHSSFNHMLKMERSDGQKGHSWVINVFN